MIIKLITYLFSYFNNILVCLKISINYKEVFILLFVFLYSTLTGELSFYSIFNICGIAISYFYYKNFLKINAYNIENVWKIYTRLCVFFAVIGIGQVLFYFLTNNSFERLTSFAREPSNFVLITFPALASLIGKFNLSTMLLIVSNILTASFFL